MKRYPAFDPPEYVDWVADPAEVARFRERLRGNSARDPILAELDEDDLLRMYRDLLRTRLHDIGLKRWVRTGVISKAWLGTGEEAVTVGAMSALDPDRDVVCPMIRNAGALHMMGMQMADMFRGYLATPDSPSRGRDLHVGALEFGVLQPISHMGTNVPVTAGAALAFRMSGRDRVALTFIGDGATRCAACHEGLVVAADRKLPVVFVLQNNQVALGTPLPMHGAGSLSDWADAYGIEGLEADGNNVLDMFAATQVAVDRCRAGNGPQIVLAETFRMGGHATHDEREARQTFDPKLFEAWGRRDPIGLYERYLVESRIDPAALSNIEEEVTSEVDRAAESALLSRERSLTLDRLPQVDLEALGFFQPRWKRSFS